MANGRIYAAGINDFGQLGIGTVDYPVISNPNLIQLAGNDWLTVTGGEQYALGIKLDGTLWAWGLNSRGQLGLGDTNLRSAPTRVGFDTDWEQVVAGTFHTLALKSDGTLWAWGYNLLGQVGDGTTTDRHSPVQVMAGVVSIAVGSDHSLAVTSDGRVWAWGGNDHGQLGLGEGDPDAHPSPTQISSTTGWVAVFANHDQSFGIRSDSSLWAWGLNTYGQLGIIDTVGADQDDPGWVGSDWVMVAPGNDHTLGVRSNGTLWAWGLGTSGALGLGDTDTQITPVQVGSDTDWETAAASSSFSLARKTDGSIWSWGLNSYGQLGLGDTDNRLIPTQIGSGTGWTQVSAGGRTSYFLEFEGEMYETETHRFDLNVTITPGSVREILRCDITLGIVNPHLDLAEVGHLYGAGFNSDGQLGIGSADSDPHPNLTRIGDADWKTISGGGGHILAVKLDGTLWAWGDNSYGKLGLGDTTDRYSPTQVGSDDDWVAVTAGAYHSLAVKADGTLWAWGRNNYGQLGDGTTTERHAPVQVQNLGNIRSMAAGDYSSVALKTDGTLWTWGQSYHGQLGIGVSGLDPHPYPIHVGTDMDWAMVASGKDSVLAIKTDGTLWGWGWNADGQLGLGSTSNLYLSVTRIGTGADWTYVSTSGNHTLAIKADDTLWATGLNNAGQLGLGHYNTIYTFTKVGAGYTWAAVDAGGQFSIGLRTEGTIWGWGINVSGELGLGYIDPDHHTTPMLIGTSYYWSGLSAGTVNSYFLATGYIETYRSDTRFVITPPPETLRSDVTLRVANTQYGHADTSWVAWTPEVVYADASCGIYTSAERYFDTRVRIAEWEAVNADVFARIGNRHHHYIDTIFSVFAAETARVDTAIWIGASARRHIDTHVEIGAGEAAHVDAVARIGNRHDRFIDTILRTSAPETGRVDMDSWIGASDIVLGDTGFQIWSWSSTWIGHIYLGGQEVQITDGIDIEDRIDERSVANLTVIDRYGTVTPPRKGTPVEINDDRAGVLFRGFVESVEEDVTYRGTRLYHLTCIDNTYLADKRLVARGFVEQHAGEIIRDMLDNILSEEGVTVGRIGEGPLVREAQFVYIPVSRAIQQLADKAGYIWWIDIDRKLYFVPRSAYEAPWTITAQYLRDGQVRVTREAPKYRNRQVIMGGKATTDPQVERFRGDGTVQSFTVGYPLAKVLTVKVNGVEKTVGIKGLDTGKDWYWSKGDPVITQDSGAPPLTASDTLEITYQGLFDILARDEDEAAILNLRQIEGIGSGIVEDMVQRTELTTINGALQEASSLLGLYARQGREIEFTTRRHGLQAGQMVRIDLPEYGLTPDRELLIESVTARDEGPIIWYTVRAVEGPLAGSWVQLFSGFITAIPVIASIGEHQILVLPANVEDSWEWTESTTPEVFSCPNPALEPYPSDTLFPC